jgi:ubiquinone/menaquinone biosynthesis C-methylase UbiE
MNAEEYANLERVEREHWYYAGKRAIVAGWLERLEVLRPDKLLLDCGAGTGLFARELRGRCRVRVLDDHAESLEILRRRFLPEEIIDLPLARAAIPDASYDAVTALDVLEHVEDDAGMVRAFHRVLKPQGVVIVTVPASRALWSDWDVALHHFRRYSQHSLQVLFPRESWEIVEIKYTNVIAFPAAWWIRHWRTWRARLGWRSGARTEDKLPPRWLNHWLMKIFVATARSRLSGPIGVSLLLVAKKRMGPPAHLLDGA